MRLPPNLRMPLILAAFAFAPMASAAQESATDEAAAAAEPNADLKALADSCSAHKFEMTVAIEGRKKGSKVRICGEPGQSDAGWLKTLESSVKSTETNDSLPRAVKDQIIAALQEEILRLKGLAATARQRADIPSASFAGSGSSLAPREPAPEYSTLPPLPTPKRATPSQSAPTKLTRGTNADPVAPPPPMVRLSLDIRCGVPPETFGTCAQIERDSQLLLSAKDDVPAGTTVRFLRGGSNQAELALGQLKRGGSVREKLPGKLCAGVMRAKVQVQVVNQGQVAQTLGPWYLSCG